MQTIVVTGVCGLIGSQFCKWLLSHTQHKIIGIDDYSGGLPENVPYPYLHELTGNSRFSMYYLDLAKELDKVSLLFSTHQVDILYHFAAYAAEGLSPFLRVYNYTNNVLATTHLINCAIETKVKRFVYTSSMAVYGNNTVPYHEDMVPNPIDPYGIAKYTCEMDLAAAYHQHGLKYTILRPHNVYGPGQNIFDKYRNVLGIWLWQSLHGLPLTIYGDGQQIRAFSYIDDLLPCLYTAGISLETVGEIINIGGTCPKSILEMATIVSDITGNTQIKHLEQRHEIKTAWSTFSKSQEMLGFKETVDLKTGIQRMWDWCQTLKDRPRKVLPIEMKTGLYSFWET